MANFAQQDPYEELLSSLDEGLSRLRLDYEQYFQGASRREPQALRAKIQRSITELMNEPPRNAAQKFRLHSLTARFHSLRNRWGQTLRQIEAGTYQPHRFKARLHGLPPASPVPARKSPAPRRASASERLFEAYSRARTKAGEGGAGISPEALDGLLKKQTKTLRKQHPNAQIAFQVVIEDNRAKIKASVKKK